MHNMNPVKTPAWQCCYLKQVIRPISSLSNKRDVQNMSPLHKRTQTQVNKYTHPFILHPQFLQFLEIWFVKSGSRKVVDQKKKIWVCRTTFLKPLFYTFLEKWLQNKWSNGSTLSYLYLYSPLVSQSIFFLWCTK